MLRFVFLLYIFTEKIDLSPTHFRTYLYVDRIQFFVVIFPNSYAIVNFLTSAFDC